MDPSPGIFSQPGQNARSWVYLNLLHRFLGDVWQNVARVDFHLEFTQRLNGRLGG